MTLIDEVREARRLPAPAAARLIRVSAGVSQTRLAREVGVHRVTIARWEAGTRRPCGRVRGRYAEILRLLSCEVVS